MTGASTFAPWDALRAEMFDTIREHRAARRKRPCLKCGKFTTALNRICCDHPTTTTEGA